MTPDADTTSTPRHDAGPEGSGGVAPDGSGPNGSDPDGSGPDGSDPDGRPASTPEGRRLHALAIEMAAMAHNGLHYATDRYDLARYHRMESMSAEIMGLLADADPAGFSSALAAEAGHATPKVDVRGALVENDRILLVQEARDGRWTLPGGWADAMDTPAEAVEREFGEEAGLAVRATKLAAVHDGSRRNGHAHSPWHIYKLLFLVERLDDAEPRAGLDGETTAVGFFALDALPDLSFPRTTTEQLATLIAHQRDGSRPADFD
jgi:ADP-ribose pyrophosphatase YjhB (NUDIX family)